jgi:hypothetical protein
MSNGKVTLPREVAEAIEKLKRDHFWSDEDLVDLTQYSKGGTYKRKVYEYFLIDGVNDK